jgi:hypothetical protein
MKKLSLILPTAVAALALSALPGCSTNTQGDSASPVFLVGNFTDVPGIICVNSLLPIQIKTTTVQNRLKNPNTASFQFLDVQVEKYTVVWRRIDGGTKASPTQDFADGFLVPPGGSTTLTDFPYMSVENLKRPPLDQLFPFNGGIDKETGRQEIRESGNVTWYGHTLSGQPVTSGVATFEIIFNYCASTGRIEPTRAK